MRQESYFLDKLSTFGDPWHGLYKNGQVELPNAMTRALAGSVPAGGDCFLVQVPGQATVTTSSDDAAAGMEWTNYALISGANHVLYGAMLNELSWIYVAPDKTVWRVDYNNGSGAVQFTRFGELGVPPAVVVQTAMAGATDTFLNTRCLDITASGNKALISSEHNSLNYQASRATANILAGVFLLEITGTPPAASINWSVLATETACKGTYLNARMHDVVRPYYLGDKDTQNGPPFIIQNSISSHVWSFSTSTDNPDVDLGPAVPTGKSFVYKTGQYGNAWVQSDWAIAEGPAGYESNYTGTKSLLGVVLGATFAGGVVPKLVTLELSLTDNFGTANGYEFSRAGALKILIGASVIETLPFELTKGVWDNVSAFNPMRLSLGGMYIDTVGTHYTVYDKLDFEFTAKHVVMAGPSPFGSDFQGYPCARFIPTRYSAQAYGFMYVVGGNWAFESGNDPWQEQNQSLVESHVVRSVFGGAPKTMSWSGYGGPGYGTLNEYLQRVFASVHPVKNQLELHSSSITFR